MAYILSKVGQSFNVPVYTYKADTKEDMNTIDLQGVPMGSKCHIINDDKWYMLNSDGKWKAMPKQVQPDWNQNDDTQPDYIKNRPFYTGDLVETVLLEETAFEFADVGNGKYGCQIPADFLLEIGQTYQVSWDGTIYECVCYVFNGIAIVGNQFIVISTSDTGEPFLIGTVENEGERFFIAETKDTSASHNISISAMLPSIVKIDEKYLPELPYMNKENPTGSGSFSLNRLPDSEIGKFSFAEGIETTASGECSHAEGRGTIAKSSDSHVQGKFNIEDSSNLYAHIVGNGTNDTARSNAHTLDWSGNAWYAGNVYVGGSNQSSGEKLMTRNELPKLIAKLVTLSASKWDADTKSQTITVFGVLADESAQLVTSTPLTMSARAYINAGVALTGREDDTVTFTAETIPTEDIKLYIVRQEIELGDYLAFSSPEPFSIRVTQPGWNGTMEYSTDTTRWTTWRGESISAVGNNGKYSLYFRGTGNTIVSGTASQNWTLAGSNISCDGNIEMLLDYITVATGGHPNMTPNCYRSMFSGCASLATAPALPATTLSDSCYSYMFSDCTSLVTAPALPATTLSDSCYSYMFRNCTSLVTAPALSATTLTPNCYRSMFSGCASLATAPALPATTLSDSCYSYMFSDCTSLVTAPALPATTLSDSCYSYMFRNCTSLVTAPALPATTLANDCYYGMLYGCTGLTQAPELPATTLAPGCYSYMFSDCASLVTAPALPTTTLASNCYDSMFSGCASLATAPALPATTLAPGCYSSMFSSCASLATAPALPATTLAPGCYGSMFSSCASLVTAPALPATTLEIKCYTEMFRYCTSLKLSSTQTEEYTIAYRIPVNGVGTTATNAMTNMFVNTGGTFTGTPVINTTYYLHKDNSIVQ